MYNNEYRENTLCSFEPLIFVDFRTVCYAAIINNIASSHGWSRRKVERACRGSGNDGSEKRCDVNDKQSPL